MKAEYDVNGKKIVVENGAITINGTLATDHVYPHHIREIKDAPKSLRDYIAKNNINTDGRVYVDCKTGLMVPREIAEEAVKQTEEKEALTDPNKVIDGYAELVAAYNDRARYQAELERSYDTSIGPKPIAVKPEEIEAKYPRAAAYAKARAYSSARNYAKSAAGEKAMEKIIAGEDYAVVIAEMDAEWHAAAQQAVLNN